jgi:hypothetical protein
MGNALTTRGRFPRRIGPGIALRTMPLIVDRASASFTTNVLIGQPCLTALGRCSWVAVPATLDTRPEFTRPPLEISGNSRPTTTHSISATLALVRSHWFLRPQYPHLHRAVLRCAPQLSENCKFRESDHRLVFVSAFMRIFALTVATVPSSVAGVAARLVRIHRRTVRTAFCILGATGPNGKLRQSND